MLGATYRSSGPSESNVSLDWLAAALDKRKAENLFRSVQPIEPHPDGTIVKNGRRLINFGSNDYLGLSNHPQLWLAADPRARSVPEAINFGSGASPLITGYTEDHAYLERGLAAFEGTEAAIITSTGFAANVGTISALATPRDVIFSDSLNHASLIDGARLSRAKFVVYQHVDLGHLESLLKIHRHPHRRAFLVTDSVFSMDGDVAPLKPLSEICQRWEMTPIVDEAHATGVLGGRGGGLVEMLEVANDFPVRIGTLSKALGCLGGFTVGSTVLIDYLRNFSRPYIYSTAMPSSTARAALAAITLATTMTLEREQLMAKAVDLRSRLAKLGFRVGQGFTPIIPIYFNDPDQVLDISAKLRDRGYFLPAIRPPTVPREQSLLRISLNTSHSRLILDQLIEAFASL
jgi:8-amino-7-oxononanoate synthase